MSASCESFSDWLRVEDPDALTVDDLDGRLMRAYIADRTAQGLSKASVAFAWRLLRSFGNF